MAAIDRELLESLFTLETMPACDHGMQLAEDFLAASGRAVETLGIADPIVHEIDVITRWRTLVEHRATCPDCNEA